MVEKEKIAIAISTRGRAAMLHHSVLQWKIQYPEAAVIVVEDNGDKPNGIAKTKNKCIEELLKTDADHFFLADDDIYPLDDKGLYRYVNSGHNHLCFTFDKNINGKRISKGVYPKGYINDLIEYNEPCGCLLYISRDIAESNIRFDENFGLWGMEHMDYSLQLHKAGLTDYAFLDISESYKHFYSYDYHLTATSSVPEHIRVKEIKRNLEYFKQKHG